MRQKVRWRFLNASLLQFLEIMEQSTTDCREIFERIPAVLSSRTQAVQTGEIRGLGPPDLCCLWKASTQKAEAEAVYSHFVVGLDVSQPTLIAAYICRLIHSQEQPKGWFRGASFVPRALYCTYDAFQKLDLRVEVKTSATGGIGVYIHTVGAFAAECGGPPPSQGTETCFNNDNENEASASDEVWPTVFLSALLRTQRPPADVPCLRVVGQLEATPGGGLQSLSQVPGGSDGQLEGPPSSEAAPCVSLVDLAARCLDRGDELGFLPSAGHGTNALCELLADHLLNQSALRRSIETLASLQGASPLLALHIARAYARSGQLEGALAALVRCLQSFPEEAWLLRQQAQLLLRSQWRRQRSRRFSLHGGQETECTKAFAALATRAAALAVEFSPAVSAHWITLGRALQSGGLFSDCLIALSQVPEEACGPSLLGIPADLQAFPTTDPQVKRQGCHSWLWLEPLSPEIVFLPKGSLWNGAVARGPPDSGSDNAAPDGGPSAQSPTADSLSAAAGASTWLSSRKWRGLFSAQAEAPVFFPFRKGFGRRFGLLQEFEESLVRTQPQCFRDAQLHCKVLEDSASTTFTKSENGVYEVLAALLKQLGADALKEMAFRLFELPREFEAKIPGTVELSGVPVNRIFFKQNSSVETDTPVRRQARQIIPFASSTRQLQNLEADSLLPGHSALSEAELALQQKAKSPSQLQTPTLAQCANTSKKAHASFWDVLAESTEATQATAVWARSGRQHNSPAQPEASFKFLPSTAPDQFTTEKHDEEERLTFIGQSHGRRHRQETAQQLPSDGSATAWPEMFSEKFTAKAPESLYSHTDKGRHRRLASVVFLKVLGAVLKDAAVCADVISGFDWKLYCSGNAERANTPVSENLASLVASNVESSTSKLAKYWMYRGVVSERLQLWDEMEAAYRIAVTFGVCPVALRALLRLYRKKGLIFETLAVAVVTCQQLGALCTLSDLQFLPAWLRKQLVKLMQREGVDAVCNVAASMEERHPTLDRYLEGQRVQFHTQD